MKLANMADVDIRYINYLFVAGKMYKYCNSWFCSMQFLNHWDFMFG